MEVFERINFYRACLLALTVDIKLRRFIFVRGGNRIYSGQGRTVGEDKIYIAVEGQARVAEVDIAFDNIPFILTGCSDGRFVSCDDLRLDNRVFAILVDIKIGRASCRERVLFLV